MMKMTPITKAVFLILICNLVLSTSISNGKSQLPQKSPSTKTLRSMARVYMSYGEYAKAQPLAEKALILARIQEAPDSELAMCLIDLATLYTYQGKLADAEEKCKSGLYLQKKVLYKYHPYIAYTLRTLSTIYYEQGDYSKARSTMDEAFLLIKNNKLADEAAMAPFFVDLAKILTAQGNLEQAEGYYQRAMSTININYGADHLYTANVIASIAKLYILQERYDEAEKLIDRAIAVQERTYGSDHYLVSESWLTKASICQRKGDLVRAEQLVNKSLAAINKSGNAAAFTKLQQYAENIRADIKVAHGPVAQVPSNSRAVNN